MTQPPGTVSKILWHFTGGPRWNDIKSRQDTRRKPAADAHKALLSILKTRELRLGGYREVVRVLLPKVREYNKDLRKMEVRRNVTVAMRSSRVCCLSDIPVVHLSYHAARYGKIAIGFHRDSAVRHGFNPVFYTLYNAEVVRSIRNGFTELRRIDASDIESLIDDIESAVQDVECDDGHPVEVDLGWQLREITSQAKRLEDMVEDARTSFREFLSFIKTFHRNDFSTIYCEREWRSTEQFSFTMDDVAMVVLPKGRKRPSYFDDFINQAGRGLKLPRSIPVVPWEDLIEH
jgi:Putative abortive phage resistance protein AbiGi, antitoxin